LYEREIITCFRLSKDGIYMLKIRVTTDEIISWQLQYHNLCVGQCQQVNYIAMETFDDNGYRIHKKVLGLGKY